MVDWMRSLNGNSVSRFATSRCCAVVALLVLFVFIVNGCGGGSSGGGGVNANPFPQSVTARFEVRDQNGTLIVGGTVNLADGTVNINAVSNAAGIATFANIKPGTYHVTVNGVGSGTVVISGDNNQTYRIIQGVGQGASGPLITGRLFSSGDNTFTCSGQSIPICARVIVRLRALNDLSNGSPIVVSLEKPDQCTLAANLRGRYTITAPGPGTYAVEVRQAPPVSATDSTPFFSGRSASFTIPPGGSGIDNITICASPSSTATPPPPPITPNPTATPGAQATATSVPTNTPVPGATATATAAPTNTPVPGATATPTATAGPTPTATTPGAGPTPTPTRSGPGGQTARRRNR